MNTSAGYRVALMVVLIVKLPGCSAGRQSTLHREAATETHTVRTDSLLFQDLFRASRNKTVAIEHIVFNSCRSDTVCSDTCRMPTFPPVHSVTRIAIDEQGVVEAESAVRSGSVNKSRSLSSDSLQKEHTADIASGKWIFRLLLTIGLLWLLSAGLKISKRK